MIISVCEDEQAQASEMKRNIEEWAKKRNIVIELCMFESAESFLFAWQDTSFDMAILDIQMKRMSGMQLATQIRDSDPGMIIVFTTALTQHVLKGYDVGALNYLIKPVGQKKLEAVLDKAYAIWSAKNNEKIVIQDGGCERAITLGSISYIDMTSHEAEIHSDSGVFRIRKTAEKLESELPSYFVRCHRSTIVNMYKVEYILDETLGLSGGEKLAISRNRRKTVSEQFMKLNTE